MSLKAKLEAVIYAAEEPVTLTQLAALFADEALEWKAQQEAASAAAQSTFAADGGSEPLIEEGLAYLGLEETPEIYAEQQAGESSTGTDGSTPSAVEVEEDALASEAAQSGEATPGAGEPEDAESEAKRLARQREREVKSILRGLLDEIIASYEADGRGIEIREIAGGYRMGTKPECHDAVRVFIKSLKPPMKLSLPALETLAVIAYKQPVTAPEVNEIRGVDSSGVFGSLLSRKLITTAGRKAVIGRPILYKTTKEFLLRFGLKDISELPSMEEFEKIAAIELDETGDESEAAFTEDAVAGPEFDENASEEPEGEPRAQAEKPAQQGPAENVQPDGEDSPHE